MINFMAYMLSKILELLTTFAIALFFYSVLQIIKCYITKTFDKGFDNYCILASVILSLTLVGLFL